MLNDLELYIRARYPIIFINSWEEERVLEAIDEMAKNRLKKATYAWTCTNGLYNLQLAGKKDLQKIDPLVMLDEIESNFRSAIFILLDFHPFLENFKVVRRLRDLAISLKQSHKTLILISPVFNLPIELQKDCVVIDFPLPSQEDLARYIDELVDQSEKEQIHLDMSPGLKEKLIRALLGLTKNETENVMAKVILQKKRLDSQAIQMVIAEKQQIVRKSGLLEYCNFDQGMEQVGGLKNLKLWLKKRMEAFSVEAVNFGLPSPKGLLLIGVQGCGKSLTAKAIGKYWNLPLLRLYLGCIFSGLVGSSEKNVRLAVQISESVSPCILWIDELEKGFSGMASSNFSDAGTAARVFGFLITWLQEKQKPVFVVATANNIAMLPPELLRKGRFDEIFFIDLPSFRERKEIFKVHLQKRHRSPDDFNLDQLAQLSEGFNGAEIEQLIISGLYDAFEHKRQLSDFDLLKNIKETIPLMKMMAEQIEQLRNWAAQRARRAS